MKNLFFWKFKIYPEFFLGIALSVVLPNRIVWGQGRNWSLTKSVKICSRFWQFTKNFFFENFPFNFISISLKFYTTTSKNLFKITLYKSLASSTAFSLDDSSCDFRGSAIIKFKLIDWRALTKKDKNYNKFNVLPLIPFTMSSLKL